MHWLANTINRQKYTIGAEVGAGVGLTTGFLLENCRRLVSLTIVDLWEAVPGSSRFDRDDMEVVFRRRFEKEKQITILKGLSWEMASLVKDRTLDFVFIDASHDYNSVLKDVQAWYPKVRNGGLFCGHDLHFPGVRKVTKKIFGTKLREAGVDNVWYVMV